MGWSSRSYDSLPQLEWRKAGTVSGWHTNKTFISCSVFLIMRPSESAEWWTCFFLTLAHLASDHTPSGTKPHTLNLPAHTLGNLSEVGGFGVRAVWKRSGACFLPDVWNAKYKVCGSVCCFQSGNYINGSGLRTFSENIQIMSPGQPIFGLAEIKKTTKKTQI